MIPVGSMFQYVGDPPQPLPPSVGDKFTVNGFDVMGKAIELVGEISDVSIDRDGVVRWSARVVA